MSLTVILIAITLPFLVAAAGIIAASQTAFFSMNYGDQVRLRRQHPKAARAIHELMARPADLLVTLLFSNMMVLTLFFVLTSLLLAEASEKGYAWLGIVISIVDLLVVMVIAEIASKMLAVRRKVELVRFSATPVRLLVRLLAPLRRVAMSMFIQPLTRLFLPPGREQTPALTTEELAALLHVGEQEGVIDSDEQRVLKQVIHLGDVRVRDVMTPRTDMEWLPESAPPEQVIELARVHRLTRIPVCRGSIDQEVIGILDVKRYLVAAARTQPPPAMKAYLDLPRYVPERATLDRLLEQFRTWHAKIALCVDEHGSVVGAVSARNIAREIAAELSGHDAEGAEEERVEPSGPGRFIVSGRFPARAFTQMFDLSINQRVSTVAGMVLSLLGRPPVVGDYVVLGNVRLTVDKVSGRMAERVAVELAGGTGVTQ